MIGTWQGKQVQNHDKALFKTMLETSKQAGRLMQIVDVYGAVPERIHSEVRGKSARKTLKAILGELSKSEGVI